MKSLKRIAMLLSMPAIAVVLAAATELPGRDDYAFGFPLTTGGGAEFFALDVPLDVYRSVSDSRLRDAGVFNAAGQPVPRMFEHKPPEEEDIESIAVLGLVPLFGEAADQPDQLRLMFRDSGGTVLEYETPEMTGEESPDEKPLTAYIVDGRELEQTLNALDFSWNEQPQGFIGRVSIEDSNDLQKWRRLTSATLADLNYEDTAIRQARVNLARKPADYLRITWQDMPDGWALDSISGIYLSKDTTARRDSVTLDVDAAGEREREHLFDIGGYPPADRVNLNLPDENIVVRATILFRDNQEERWRQAYSGLFYNITRQGNSVQSEPAAMRSVRARYWKVRIDSGVIAGAPQLLLGWHPDRLVFLAQGSGPFELVAGRGNDRVEGFPQEAVLGDSSIFRMLRESGEAGTASPGPRVEIAGFKQLEVAPTSPIRVALLWLGLAGAIIFVGWLVLSLMREMRS
jgi:hypothetical protein